MTAIHDRQQAWTEYYALVETMIAIMQEVHFQPWRQKAACRGAVGHVRTSGLLPHDLDRPGEECEGPGHSARPLDENLFFPQKGHGGPETAKSAKEMCRSCPVRAECLAFATENRLQYGIWGAMGVEEMRSARTAQRSAAA